VSLVLNGKIEPIEEILPRMDPQCYSVILQTGEKVEEIANGYLGRDRQGQVMIRTYHQSFTESELGGVLLGPILTRQVSVGTAIPARLLFLAKEPNAVIDLESRIK